MAQKLNSQQCQMAQTAQKMNFKKTYSKLVKIRKQFKAQAGHLGLCMHLPASEVEAGARYLIPACII